MLNRQLDYTQSYLYICYGRMSTKQQNVRSPEQQFDTIAGILRRLGYPWIHVRDFRDDGKSGKVIRDRPGFSEMMNSIRCGALKVDLILVDTIERFGRMDNLDTVRRDLLDNYGVAVLTADNNFADPMTASGKIVGMVEHFRATEDGRIKAHNVLRGKRDSALLKKWPGSQAPFGLKLQTIVQNESGQAIKPYSIPVPELETAWIIKLAFQEALNQGLGANRLARYLNERPDIPAKFKPFNSATVGRWLQNTIYYGELAFGKKRTGVVSDHRVVERNEEVNITRVANFCEPLIEKSLFDEVQAMRIARTRPRRNRAQGTKLLRPTTPGMALTFPLTGLVRCGHCRRSMRPSSNPYQAADGTTTSYRRYTCPAHFDGTCPNDRYIDERWLIEQVAGVIRTRVLGV